MITVYAIDILKSNLELRKHRLKVNHSKYTTSHLNLLERSIMDLQRSIDILDNLKYVECKSCASCRYGIFNKSLELNERFCECNNTSFLIIEDSFYCNHYKFK